MERRRLLAGTGLAAAVALGGCLQTGDRRSDGDDDGDATDAAGADAASDSQDGSSPSSPETGDGTSDTPAGNGSGQQDCRYSAWPTDPYADYDTTLVQIRTPGGSSHCTVRAAIAATATERYRGLSDAPSLPRDAGMLFVFDSPGSRTFVMREMDFGIDIVYADGDRTVTEIHHAPAPEPGEDGSQQHYSGYGQYVLEVNYGESRRKPRRSRRG